MTLVAAVAVVWPLGHLSAMDVAITAAVVRAIAAMNAANAMWQINSAIGTTASQTGAFKGAANQRGPPPSQLLHPTDSDICSNLWLSFCKRIFW